MTHLKKAILLTGAAARISQEVAIFDKLQERSVNPLSISEQDTVIAGFSSGSLNLMALNACFRDDKPLDWKSYYQEKILFTLNNKDVFKNRKIPFIPLKDTTPLRKTLNRVLSDTNQQLVKDLSFESYILTMLKRKGKDKKHKNNKETLWACSKDALHEYLQLSDVLMSSTAIPVVFPSQKIHCTKGHNTDFPKKKYRDGGTRGTFVNFKKHLGKRVQEQGAFEELYVISPMRESSDEEIRNMENSVLNDHHNFEKPKLKGFLSHISMKTFMKFLVKLNDWKYEGKAMAKHIYVCIPEMESNYPILDFDHEKEQYQTVCNWINKHPQNLAIPLQEFINDHKKYTIQEQI